MPRYLIVLIALKYRSFVQENWHNSRGSAYLFAPLVDFDVMAEVGDAPP